MGRVDGFGRGRGKTKSENRSPSGMTTRNVTAKEVPELSGVHLREGPMNGTCKRLPENILLA
jgi:hypothetical protein